MDEQPAAAEARREPTPGERLEAAQPEWQRWLNRFCENWIFAFIVAMAVRHFCLEAFRIPTASMEPMLYGDPAVSQSDHVVVDKLVSRFRGVHRWDVTVFQFPQPEIRKDGVEVTAYDETGKRVDNLLTNPLSYRNFVKRAVILPGDRFYIANGDLFLQRPDGSFSVERKPAAIQEAVWQDVYRQDKAGKYRPWKAASGAGVAEQGDRLSLRLGGGSVEFTQPMRNLYLKPGKVRVQSRLRGELDELVEVSMVSPEFTLKDGTKGNIWDLDQWTLFRLTSADLDNAAHGKELNQAMHEYVGDVRLLATVAELQGRAVLRIAEGTQQRIDLSLDGTGWQLDRNGEVVGRGPETAAGKEISLANIDDQAVVVIGGKEVARIEVAAVDPQLHPTTLSWFGDGSVVLAGLRIQRDTHYCANGFLQPADAALGDYRRWQQELASAQPFERDRRIQASKTLRDMAEVRAMMLGKRVEDLGKEEVYRPVGDCPERAITAPKDVYLMLGDNSPLSWDGRNWGWVPAMNLRGRVLAVVLWPQRWHIVR